MDINFPYTNAAGKKGRSLSTNLQTILLQNENWREENIRASRIGHREPQVRAHSFFLRQECPGAPPPLLSTPAPPSWQNFGCPNTEGKKKRLRHPARVYTALKLCTVHSSIVMARCSLHLVQLGFDTSENYIFCL